MGKKGVATFSRLFLIGSMSNFQVTITYTRAWMNMKFGLIRLLVSMVTDRIIMRKKRCCHFLSAVFIRSFSYLQVMMTCRRAMNFSKFGQIRPLTVELAALEHSKKSRYTYNGKNGVATFSQLILIKSFSYLQVTMTCIRAWMSSKFGQIRSGTTELAALEHLKNRSFPFFSSHSCGYTWEIVR